MLFRSFPWGALAFALAVLALLAASVIGVRSLTIALAALGVIAAVVGLPGFSLRSDRRWLIVGGLLGSGVVLLALFAPGVLNSFWAMDIPVPETDPNPLVVTPRDQPRGKGKPLAANTWADTDKEAIRQDDLLIWVDSVVAGRLPEKPATPYLIIDLKLSQIRTEREITVAPLTGKNLPVLTDAAGRAAALIEQRPRQAYLTVFEPTLIDQLLIFEVPAAILQLPAAEGDFGELQADLKFEVPAAAWGRQGVCRFRITRILDERDLTPAKLVARYKKELLGPPDEPPDPLFGRAVFARFCYACHTIFGFGTKVGPDLTDRGLTPDGRPKRTDLDFLLTSIIHPSGEFAKDYEPSVVALTNGQFIPGIIKAKTAETVTLVTPNQVLKLPTSEIEEIIPSKISLMPTDLLKGLDEHELRSLIAYISGPGQTPMLATPGNTLAFFNGKNLDYWRSDVTGWKMDKDELVAPEPHGGAPAVLTSELLSPPPFRVRLQIQRGKDSAAALVLYGKGDEAVPAVRIAFTADGRVELANAGGKRTITAPGAVRPDAWHNLEVNVAGKQIKMKLDGKEEAVLTGADIPERCFIALQGPAVSGQRFRFRNLDLYLPGVKK